MILNAARAMRLGRICIATVLLGSSLTLPSAMAVSLTASPDAFESPKRDDTPSNARDVTPRFRDAWYGFKPHTQSRTFDFVNDATKTSDEDWIRFTVTTGEWAFGQSYLFEAITTRGHVNPVIEVYGPYPVDSALSLPSPTAPGSLGPDPARPDVTQTDPKAIAASQANAWNSGPGASVSFIPPTGQRDYYVRVRPYYQHAGGPDPGFRQGAGSYTLRMKVGQMTRLAGADRLLTAAAISKERFRSGPPASKAVIVANGWSFPDALAGSTLAGMLGCPILLTAPTKLSATTAAEISRLGVDRVYVLGGTGAIAPAVVTSLRSMGLEVEQVAAARRAGTAVEIARTAARIAPTSEVAFVVNAQGFADALAVSPMATHNAAPVLLTERDWLPGEVLAALDDGLLGITDVVIVGGTAAVSAKVEKELKQRLGDTRVRRIQGSTRYHTAREFAVWATDAPRHRARVGTAGNSTALKTLEFGQIGIASGQDFPDALAGGVFCGLAGSPILLTRGSQLSGWVFADLDKTDEIKSGMDYYGSTDRPLLRSYLFGGSSVINDDVFLDADLITGPGIY